MAGRSDRNSILLALILKWTLEYNPKIIKDLSENGLSRADAEDGIQSLVKSKFLKSHRKVYDPQAKIEYDLNILMILRHPKLFREALVLTKDGEDHLWIDSRRLPEIYAMLKWRHRQDL